MQYEKIYIHNTIFIHTWYIFSNPKFWNEIPQLCKYKKICDVHIHLEPTHEHLTTIQFLVASPAFCRYSIYFLHCAPPIPTTIISTNTNTKKIKHWLHHHWSNQLYAPSPPESCPPATDAPQITPILRPHPFFDVYDKNIRWTIDPTRARAISSEQQKIPRIRTGF